MADFYQQNFNDRLRNHSRASALLLGRKSASATLQGSLELIQEQFPDYHPLTALAQLVNLPETNLEQRIAIHTTLAKYVAPQLKQVDINAHIDSETVYRPRIMRFDGSVDEDDAEDAIYEEVTEGLQDPEELFI